MQRRTVSRAERVRRKAALQRQARPVLIVQGDESLEQIA